MNKNETLITIDKGIDSLLYAEYYVNRVGKESDYVYQAKTEQLIRTINESVDTLINITNEIERDD